MQYACGCGFVGGHRCTTALMLQVTAYNYVTDDITVHDLAFAFRNQETNAYQIIKEIDSVVFKMATIIKSIYRSFF